MLPALAPGRPVTVEGQTGKKTEIEGLESGVVGRAVVGMPLSTRAAIETLTVSVSDTDIFYLSIWLCLRWNELKSACLNRLEGTVELMLE